MDKDKHSCKNPDVCNRFKQGQQAHCCDKGENKCQRPESCPRKKKYPNDPCCQSEKSTQVHEAEVVDLEAGCPNTCPRRQKYPNDPCCKGKVESICPETCPRKNKYPKTPCCESKVSASMKDECSRPGICAHKTKYPREPCCVQPADGRTPPKKEDSTQVLYMMPNFEPTPSEQDKFYDCISESDVPDEGSTKSTRTSFDDPQAMRVALQRASDAAQKLLKNFDSCKDVARSQYDEPQVCSANLEISAKLTSLSGSQENDIRCNPYTVRIDPITFKIPITFNVPAGVCPCQTSLNEPLLTATVARPQLAYSTGPDPKADSDRYFRNLIPPEDERPTTSRKANLQRSRADDRDPNESKFPIATQTDLYSKGLGPNAKPSQADTPLLFDSSEKKLNDKFELHSKSSQTDASFLRDKAIREGKVVQPQSSDDDLAPNAKRSQTDASFLKDKAIREGKIIKSEEDDTAKDQTIKEGKIYQSKVEEDATTKDKPVKEDKIYKSDDSEDATTKKSQTELSYLKTKRLVTTSDMTVQAGPEDRINKSDDSEDATTKKSQTELSYIKSKRMVTASEVTVQAGPEGRIIKLDDSEDATMKKSQTELSYIKSKRMLTTIEVTVEASRDRTDTPQNDTCAQRGSLRSNKIHYPTIYRAKQSEKSEDKNLKTCVCKDADAAFESQSDNEVLKEIFCRRTKMSSQKNVDGVEDVYNRKKAAAIEQESSEEKVSCCQKPSQLSSENRKRKDDEGVVCERPTGVDKKRRKRGAPENDVLVLSEKDIKIRGGFKPLDENENFSESWYTYDDQSIKASSGAATPTQDSGYKVAKKVSLYPNIYMGDTEQEQFMSCESSSNTSFSKSSSQNDKFKQCTSVCSGENQKYKNKSASATTCFCSIDSQDMDNSSSITSVLRNAENILSNISNVGVKPSTKRCSKCGKKLSSPNVKKESIHRCDICGKKSKQSVKRESEQRCNICGKKSKQSVKKEIDEPDEACANNSERTVSNDSDHPCEVCGKKKSKQSVNNDTEQPCGICGKNRRQSNDNSETNEDGNAEEEDDTNGAPAEDGSSHDSDQNECMLSCRCSTDPLTCQDDPDAPCQTPQLRQDKIVRLLENLTEDERCPGPISEQRATMVQKLFKEITFLLCREPPQKETTEDEKTVRSQMVAKKKKQAQLQCCLSKMQEYIEECFLKGYTKPMPKITDEELYQVEPDPDFVYKEGGRASGEEWLEECPGEAESFGCETALAKAEECIEEEEHECLPCEMLKRMLEEEMMKGMTEEEMLKRMAEEEMLKRMVEEECGPSEMLKRMGEEQTECSPCKGEEDDIVCTCDDYDKPCPNICSCCHCRALRCQQECKTVATLQSVMYDPACEMKYFIDSMIIDLDTMEKVLHAKDAKPKPEKPLRRPNRALESFPVKITEVNDLGLTSLYIQWEIFDCCGIAGYEIYVDGQLTNRFYSPAHQSGVICDVNVNRMHQIVLRAQPVGEDFPGDSCTCTTVAKSEPSAPGGPGSSKPWVPSIYLYDPCLKVV